MRETARQTNARLHVVEGSRTFVPAELFDTVVTIDRAAGPVDEPLASTVPEDDLAVEWEWENSPEITLVVVETLDDGVELFNRYSPHFVASLISADPAEHERFYAAIDAPFVGNGFTRWVDGQYSLDKPELGSVELAGRTDARSGRDPVRRQRAHGPLSRDGHRHGDASLSMRVRAGVVAAVIAVSALGSVCRVVLADGRPTPSAGTTTSVTVRPDGGSTTSSLRAPRPSAPPRRRRSCHHRGTA